MHITLICADADNWALGMRSVSAVLRAVGHETQLIFAGSIKTLFRERSIKEIRSLCASSDIIGVSSMSRGSKRAKEILDAVRSLGKVTVWGGMHPTIFAEDCVAYADLICRGEGEGFMLDLAESVASGSNFQQIPNAGYYVDGKIVLNDVRPLITDLDKLPLPDFSFEKEFTLDASGGFGPNLEMKRVSSILFSGSRGCIYGCDYCSNSRLRALYAGKGRFARKMSIPRFIELTKECRRLFPDAKYFYFTDEEFFGRPIEEFREFAEIYPSEVGLPFECMVSPLQVTEEKARLVAKAGIWRIMVGVESGSDRTKKHVFKRPANNDSVMRSARVINRIPEIVAYYFFIIGNPYEKREDLLETIRFLRELPPTFFIRTYSLVFIPGTRLFDRACADGVIKGLEDSGYEMDFLGGLSLKGPQWKKMNLYLNGLIAMMAGRFTKRWMGFLPRAIIPILTRPKVIDFCDGHVWIGKIIIGLAKGGQWLRRTALVLVTGLARNPKAAFGLNFLIGRRAEKAD